MSTCFAGPSGGSGPAWLTRVFITVCLPLELWWVGLSVVSVVVVYGQHDVDYNNLCKTKQQPLWLLLGTMGTFGRLCLLYCLLADGSQLRVSCHSVILLFAFRSE